MNNALRNILVEQFWKNKDGFVAANIMMHDKMSFNYLILNYGKDNV